METERFVDEAVCADFDCGCSSFVPIVETESQVSSIEFNSGTDVAAHSFRLWKLKVTLGARVFGASGGLQLIRSDCGN